MDTPAKNENLPGICREGPASDLRVRRGRLKMAYRASQGCLPTGNRGWPKLEVLSHDGFLTYLPSCRQ